MHGKILCVSCAKDYGTCEEDYELLGKLDCDWIGENCPDETEWFIAKFLQDSFEWHPIEKEDDSTCQGYLLVTDKAKANIYKMWEKFQKNVSKYTAEEAYNVFGDYFPFLENFNVRCSDYVVMFEERPMSIFSFIADMDRFYKGEKLYVNGCVDFHI